MELEKLLQDNILDTYSEFKKILNDNENMDKIFKNIDNLILKISKKSDMKDKIGIYENIINLLCLIYTQNNIVVDKLKYSLTNMNIYNLKSIKLKIDQVLYYEDFDNDYKPITTREYLEKSKELLSIPNVDDFDYTLLISDGIVSKKDIDADANIINFKIKNTRCVEYNIRNLTDNNYIKDNFSYSANNGINEIMIKRYETIKIYDDNNNNVIKSTPILSIKKDIKDKKVLYQHINDNYVRKLIPIKYFQAYDKSDTLLKDYNDINIINQVITHLESFEMSLLRTNIYDKNKAKKINNSSKTGTIESYLKKNTIEDSLWKTFNKGEDKLRIATKIYNLKFDALKLKLGKRFIKDKNFIQRLNDIY